MTNKIKPKNLLDTIALNLSELRCNCGSEDGFNSYHEDFICEADNYLSLFKNKVVSLTCDNPDMKEGFELAKKMILEINNK